MSNVDKTYNGNVGRKLPSYELDSESSMEYDGVEM